MEEEEESLSHPQAIQKTTSSDNASLDGVKQKIMRQQMEIDEKSRSLELFKNEIRKLKDEMKEQAQQL